MDYYSMQLNRAKIMPSQTDAATWCYKWMDGWGGVQSTLRCKRASDMHVAPQIYQYMYQYLALPRSTMIYLTTDCQ